MTDQTPLHPAKPAPQINVPLSDITVKVSIIDTTSHISGIPTSVFVQPQIKGYDYLDCPAFSFLIEHPDGRRILFDLGVRKDWSNLAPRIVNRIKDNDWRVTIEKGVSEILLENDVKPESIEGIVWRYSSPILLFRPTPNVRYIAMAVVDELALVIGIGTILVTPRPSLPLQN